MKNILTIATVAAIAMTLTAPVAAAADYGERSYLPPQSSQHRTKKTAPRAAKHEARHRDATHRYRAGAPYRYSRENDFSPEDVILFFPRVLVGILDAGPDTEYTSLK